MVQQHDQDNEGIGIPTNQGREDSSLDLVNFGIGALADPRVAAEPLLLKFLGPSKRWVFENHILFQK